MAPNQDQDQDLPLDLTIGLELELVFIASAPFWGSHPYSTPLRTIANLLQQKCGTPLGVKFRYNSSRDIVYDLNRTWTVQGESNCVEGSDVERFEGFKRSVRSGVLEQDVGMVPVRRTRKGVAMPKTANHPNKIHELEIVSPILRLSEIDSWSRVLRGIEETLVNVPLADPQGTAYDAWAGRGTGLHVHVALGKYEYLGLHTLQNLVAIWGCFESQLGRLQPKRRHQNPYAKSLWVGFSDKSSLGERYEEIKGMSCERFCAEVYSAEDIGQLADIVNPWTRELEDIHFALLAPRYSRLNLQGLVRAYENLDDDSLKLTVEFREHVGTLSAEEIRWWVLLIAACVRFAERLEREKLCWAVVGVLDLEYLWEMVDFEVEGRAFYRARMDALAREEALETQGV